MKALNVSDKITVVPTVPSNFLNYDGAFKVIYTNLKELVKNNHISTCNDDYDELINLTFWESNLDAHILIHHTTIWPSRGKDNLKDLHNQSSELLQAIKPPRINPYKQVALYYNCGPVVPTEYHQDKIYTKPPNDSMRKVKEEKVVQIKNRAKVKAVKENKVGATDLKEDAFGLKKLKVPEIKAVLKNTGSQQTASMLNSKLVYMHILPMHRPV